FHRDVAAAHDGYASRRRGEIEEAIGIDAQLRAGYRRSNRPAAGGQQDLRRTDADTVAAFDHAGTGQSAARWQHRDASGVQALAIAGVDVADVALAEGDERRPVERGRRFGEVEAQFARQRELVRDVAGQPHRLLRHAADVDAGAAEFGRFEDRD